MAKRSIFRSVAVVLAFGMCMTGLAGCGSEKRADGKTEIEVVSYKPEAVKAFEKIEKRFNETHDDIHLTISSPNEAMTILKTRFIREDYPDIIAIGGDINYSNFLDADLFDDISDLDEVHIYDSLSNATCNGKVSSVGGSVTYTIRIFFHVFQIHMFCIKNTRHFFKGEQIGRAHV